MQKGPRLRSRKTIKSLLGDVCSLFMLLSILSQTLPKQCTEALDRCSLSQKCKNNFPESNSRCHQMFQSDAAPKIYKFHFCLCQHWELERVKYWFANITESNMVNETWLFELYYQIKCLK